MISAFSALAIMSQANVIGSNLSSAQTSLAEVDPLENMTFTQNISEVSYNTDLNNQAIEKKYGLSIDDVNEIAENTSTAKTQSTTSVALLQSNDDSKTSDTTNALQFTLQCVSEEESYYSAQGTINLNGVVDSFFVQGQMYRTELNDGNICFAGGLSGYLNNDDSSTENVITLSINYDYTTGERFVTASIGSCMVLNFGEPFDKTTEIFDNISEEIQATANEADPATTSGIATASEDETVIEDESGASGAKKLIATASGAWNGYSTTFVSIWGNNSAKYSGIYTIRTKAQGRRPQFVAASKVGLKNTGDAYCIVDAIDHIFTNVWTINNSVNDSVNCMSLSPEPQSKTYSFSLPIQTPYAAVNYIMSLISIPISIKGIKHWKDNANQKAVVRCWNTDLTCLNCSTGYSIMAS